MTSPARSVLVAAGLLLTVAATGCSAGAASQVAGLAPSSAASPVAGVAATDITLEEYFDPIVSAIGEAGSYRGRLVMSGAGIDVSSTFVIGFDGDELSLMHMVLTQPASAYTEDPADTNDVSVEMIIIGSDLYMSLPDELGLNAPTRWLSSTLDATDPFSQMLVEMVATLDRDSYFGALNEQYIPYTRVEESRSITGDGGAATRTELVFDFAAMAEDLGLDAESAPMDEVRYFIVTDASSRLLSVTSDLGGLGQLVAHYSNYGRPIDVTPPPVGEVSPLADLFQ
jgi:hypothetical protein